MTGNVFHSRPRTRFGLSLMVLCLLFPFGGLNAAAQPEDFPMWMTIGTHRFGVTLEETETARACAAQLPLTLDMAELNGNEKYADLPHALPTKDSRPGTIRTGDLMVYRSRSLVVFYRTFDTSYAYTRIGRVDDPEGLAEALGSGRVRIEFSKD